MEFQQYINTKKEIQNLILEYVETDNDEQKYFTKIINYFNDLKIHEDKYELKEILYIFSNILNNHYRSINFFTKFEQILLYYKDEINKKFSNSEIFEIFKINKRIILFLFEEKFLVPNQSIANFLFNQPNSNNYMYFYIELSQFIDEKLKPQIQLNFEQLEIDLNDIKNKEIFETKRKTGENDSYLCDLIRQDSINDFIWYINHYNMRPTSKINNSIFETNPFLIDKKNFSLIEYAAFFGSFQIFNYLRFNNVELSQSLWLYAIHGNNPKIIHLLEEIGIEPNINSILIESIKCHHNDISNYIENTKLDEKVNMMIFSYCLQFHNINMLKFNISKKAALFHFCQFNYINFVRIFLKDQDIDVNSRIISLFFFNCISNYFY